MPDLRIQIAKDNGDLPKDHGHKKDEQSRPADYFTASLLDIFNPLKMKEALDKANGRTNKDKE